MARFGMIIDLDLCVGCGACDIACKSENNTPIGIDWSFHEIKVEGEFPDVDYRYTPKLCNHCEDAPCVEACPTGAMHIDERYGITAHDSDLCIGCRACMLADPYNVIYFNEEKAHIEWSDDVALVEGGTSSPKEIAHKSGLLFPNINLERGVDYATVRPKGVVEKCNFCSHLTPHGLQPACVVACPAGARIFGDLDNAQEEIVTILKTKKSEVLLEEKGTKPKVFYIGRYNKR